MTGSPRNSSETSDVLLRWLGGTGIGLAALHVVLVLFLGAQPATIAVLQWYVPTMHVLVALAALSVAFLSFGRYQVLREATPFWIGVAFGTFAIFAVFYILSWPGILPSGPGLTTNPLNIAGWFWHLQFSVLAIFLLVSLFARWPQAGAAGERHWFWLVMAGMLVLVLIGWLSIAFEQSLPLLVVDGAWTSLNVGWIWAIWVAFVVGMVLSVRRYQETGDSLLAYVALTQMVLGFAMLSGIIGGRFFNFWWYWQRVLWAVGFTAMLFGLLSEYVLLYRRERERTREVEEQRNRLRVLVDTTPTGIVFHSAPDGLPVLFNKAAETLVGQPLAPGVGIADQPTRYGIHRPTGEPFPPEELPAGRSLRGETCMVVEMLIRQPYGREVYVLTNSAPLRGARGEIVGAVVAFQDITPIKEQERLRDEFLDAAAHELKTPVTTIKGYTQLMRQWAPGGHEPREAQAIAVIDAQCNRINRRVQEMLEAVRFRRVPPELRRVRFDLGDLASEVVQRMQATTQLHQLLLVRNGPVPVEGDRERIEEVLVSLLDNAIKYSPKGGVIEVRSWAQNGEAIASVRDHGVGIPEERWPHIFEPFYEAVPSGVPGYVGVVALSLYLSKLVIERHKGRIWFESEEGRGSTFYFSLPLAKEGGNGERG